jgi:hypothetical protein
MPYDAKAAIRRIDKTIGKTRPPLRILESATEVQAELEGRFGHLGAEDQFSIAEYVATVLAGVSGNGGDLRMTGAAWVYGVAATRLAAPLRKAAA